MQFQLIFFTVFSKALWNRAESVSTREKSYHKAIKTWKVFRLASATCYSSSSWINDTVLVEASLGIWRSSSHSNSPTLGFLWKILFSELPELIYEGLLGYIFIFYPYWDFPDMFSWKHKDIMLGILWREMNIALMFL